MPYSHTLKFNACWNTIMVVEQKHVKHSPLLYVCAQHSAQYTDSCPAHASGTKVEHPPSCQCPAHSHHVILSRRSCHSGE